ncbi:MAG: YbaK/proline--tRNA ligase associated domain protein [Bacteroidetes bacterium 38_7]|nr:MAG: YbaK/proline--tRNA ligase associated domain protein [Bacteroidetes bacterium 38_7]HAL65733.1 prolyl-tRNA editing protein [Bacteroidales bacterium]
MKPKGENDLYPILDQLGIHYHIYRHPPAPTIEIAREFWKDIPSSHCKNIFLRNHKGNKHYLVIIEYTQNFSIHSLEKRLHQGKLTFASPKRLMKYLGVTSGNVSPYALINDVDHHVHLFIDETLLSAKNISFHPLTNTASLVTSFDDFLKFLNWTTNTYEFTYLTNEHHE